MPVLELKAVGLTGGNGIRTGAEPVKVKIVPVNVNRLG